LPDWEAKKPEPEAKPEPAKPAKKTPAVQAVTTFYDVGGLEGDVKQKAIKYLVDCLAEEIRPDIYQTKVTAAALNQLHHTGRSGARVSQHIARKKTGGKV
jgi:hypothetical protein